MVDIYIYRYLWICCRRRKAIIPRSLEQWRAIQQKSIRISIDVRSIRGICRRCIARKLRLEPIDICFYECLRNPFTRIERCINSQEHWTTNISENSYKYILSILMPHRLVTTATVWHIIESEYGREQRTYHLLPSSKHSELEKNGEYITTTLITHRSSDLFVSLRWDLLIISYYFFWLAVDKTTIAIPIIFLSVLALIQHDIERKIRQIDIWRVSLCMCVCVRCTIWPLAENTNNKQQQSGMNQPSKGKSYSRLFFFLFRK